MFDLPLLQAKDVITLRTLSREVRDTEPAGLAVIAGTVVSTDDVLDDFLSGGSGMDLGVGAETAGEDDAGDGVSGGAAEGADSLGSTSQTQAGAQRREERHD
jgi:hypothetical protein